MTLQTFIRAGRLIYQVKIRGGSSYREEVMGGSCFDQELEDIIRTVLGNLDSLQPFSSAHFNVFPYKKQWEGGSNVLCQQYERKLRVYPFILHLYLERNMQNSEEEHTFTACSGKSSAEQFSPQKEVAEQIPSASELQSKRRKRDSTLEDAVLKDLEAELEAEAKISVRLHVDKKRRREEEVEEVEEVKEVEEDPADEQLSGVSMLTGSGTPGEVEEDEEEDKEEEEDEEEDKEEEEDEEEEEEEDKEDEEEEEEEDKEDEEDKDEEEDNVESAKPGILTRLVSIFPFSWFFRTPERRG